MVTEQIQEISSTERKANIYSQTNSEKKNKEKVVMNLDSCCYSELEWKEKLKFNIPLGNKLFFLVHVIFGIGLPVAEHSSRTGDPFFTCKWPPDVT